MFKMNMPAEYMVNKFSYWIHSKNCYWRRPAFNISQSDDVHN